MPEQGIISSSRFQTPKASRDVIPFFVYVLSSLKTEKPKPEGGYMRARKGTLRGSITTFAEVKLVSDWGGLEEMSEC